MGKLRHNNSNSKLAYNTTLKLTRNLEVWMNILIPHVVLEAQIRAKGDVRLAHFAHKFCFSIDTGFPRIWNVPLPRGRGGSYGTPVTTEDGLSGKTLPAKRTRVHIFRMDAQPMFNLQKDVAQHGGTILANQVRFRTLKKTQIPPIKKNHILQNTKINLNKSLEISTFLINCENLSARQISRKFLVD